MMEMHRDAKQETIAHLQRQIRQSEYGGRRAADITSTGSTALDELLPCGGVRRGGMIEWIGCTPASGAGTLALIAARHVCASNQTFLVIDSRRQISPAALANLGLDLAKILIVRPQTKQEAWWACEEALRCKAIGLVWADIEQASATVLRRLQLAAEESCGVGFLLRPAAALRHSAWADARLLVRSVPSCSASPRYQVESVYSHGRALRNNVVVQIDRFAGTTHEFTSSRQASLMSLVS